MTDLRADGRPDDWDDDRLAAAFASRALATPPTPSLLIDEVLARKAVRTGGLFGWAPVPVMAVALLLVAVIGGSVISGTPKATPTGPPVSGEPNASTDVADPIPTLLGGPMTVSEALAVRDAEDRGREIVVAGFLSPLPTIYCSMESGPFNPTDLGCPQTKQWVMQEPEQLWGPSTSGTHEPAGAAFHPSFTLVEPPDVPMPTTDDELPVRVVLIGHFDDRRARLCAGYNKERCAETFVVDRVTSVDGTALAVTTWRKTRVTPRDNEAMVDALVASAAPRSLVLSRQLMTVARATQVEPLLANNPLMIMTDPDKPVWIDTVLDVVDGDAVIRTFLLLDGSSWFAEITPAVVKHLEWTLPEPTDGSGPVRPSSDPNAFASAPTSILGIPVRDIATLERDRQASMDEGGRDEVALRAWYVAPNPAITCDDAPPPIHEPRPPCDENRHWLLDDPWQFGVMAGQIRRDPSIDHFPPVLNPLLPVDVPFDVGSTWAGETPQPRPVIVLGHFADHRVDTYAGNLYFVIDALAWTPDGAVESFDTLTRLTTNAREDLSTVLARIDAVSPNDAVATWVTVADAADLAALDRRSEYLSELTSGPPVWMVARLIRNDTDGRQRLAVVWAWTADGGARVWRDECPDCSPDLGTSLDIVDLDGNTPLVRVFDYSQAIVSVGSAAGLSSLDWQKPHGNSVDFMDIARGRTARELVLRWRSGAECGTPWDITVYRAGDERFDGDDIYLSPTTTGEGCEGALVTRRVVIVFEDPVDIDRISGPSCCG